MWQIVFDLDGTLWAPHSVALPAFKQVFAQLGMAVPADDILLNTLGYPIGEIWTMLWPEGSPQDHKRASRLMGTVEERLLDGGQVTAFPGVLETLDVLKNKGWQLYILSNCDEEYLHAVPRALGIYPYFAELHCAGMYPKWSKARILNKILRGNKKALMVGDRHHDIDAGKANGISTIWCAYGLATENEIEGQTFTAYTFKDILPIAKLIRNNPITT